MALPDVSTLPSLSAAGFGFAFLAVLALAIAAPLVLYALVDSETERERIEGRDWESAERAARRDTDASDAPAGDERESDGVEYGWDDRGDVEYGRNGGDDRRW
jgi:hypothetical protein